MNIFELDGVKDLPEEENLMIVDCLNLSFRYKHRGQTEFSGDYLRTIKSLARSYGAKQVVLTADKGKSAYRLDIRPEYKSGRKEKYKDQSEEEKQKVKEFFDGYERALELTAEKYPLLRLKGVEADDLAAYIVKHYKHKYKNVWLISSDKDWDLLLDDNVHRFSFVTRKEYKTDTFYEDHGCDTPEQYVCCKALMGDDGDTIAGIPSVGAKRAYNLTTQYGSAMDLVDAIPLEGKQVVIQNINKSADLILDNLLLVDLLSYCEDAIEFVGGLNEVEKFCEENL
jgi:5'-3' exonuclease